MLLTECWLKLNVLIGEKMIFQNRVDAAKQLAKALRDGRHCGSPGLHAVSEFRDPVVLGIPRGGVATAAVLATHLNADLDVLLARKIRSPYNPEVAMGAVNDNGEVHLYRPDSADEKYLQQEVEFQKKEIQRRRQMVEKVADKVSLRGRSVIVTDDGCATGSTIIAGLHGVSLEDPYEIIVAVPVAAPQALESIRKLCHELICLHSPEGFVAIGGYYRDFSELKDSEMLEILQSFHRKKVRSEVDRGTVQHLS